MDGFFHDAGGAASPAGVNGTGAAGDRVVKQQDAAVGRENHQRQVLFGGDQGVGLVVPGLKQALAGIGGGNSADSCFMDLFAEYRPVLIGTQAGEKAPVILGHVFRRVSPSGAQASGNPGGGGDAAQPGGKRMAHAGEQGEVR